MARSSIFRRGLLVLICVSLTCIFGLSEATQSEPSFYLYKMYSSGMVFRSGHPVCFCGGGQPGTVLSMTLGKERTSLVIGEDGAWRGCFTPRGPAVIEVFAAKSDDGTSVVLNDINFGMTFLCSGQSNMEFETRKLINASYFWNEASQLKLIRLMRIQRAFSDTPQADAASVQSWNFTNADTLWDFSSVCYLFARNLFIGVLDRKIPVGIIESTWGGTRIESWSRQHVINECPLTPAPYPRTPSPNNDHFTSPSNDYFDMSQLYNAMIEPVLGASYGLDAILWYQGESNCVNATHYSCLFPRMIKDWRSRAQQGNIPFMYVELHAYNDTASRFQDMRLAQSAALTQPNVGVVTAMDLGDPLSPYSPNHPRDKVTVASRMYNLALNMLMHKNAPYLGPQLNLAQSSLTTPNTLRLTFTSTAGSLVFKGSANCALCCNQVPVEAQLSDGTWVRAVSVSPSNGTQVIATFTTALQSKTAVRYAYAQYPECVLYGGDGLPARLFWVTLP